MTRPKSSSRTTPLTGRTRPSSSSTRGVCSRTFTSRWRWAGRRARTRSIRAGERQSRRPRRTASSLPLLLLPRLPLLRRLRPRRTPALPSPTRSRRRRPPLLPRQALACPSPRFRPSLPSRRPCAWTFPRPPSPFRVSLQRRAARLGQTTSPTNRPIPSTASATGRKADPSSPPSTSTPHLPPNFRATPAPRPTSPTSPTRLPTSSSSTRVCSIRLREGGRGRGAGRARLRDGRGRSGVFTRRLRRRRRRTKRISQSGQQRRRTDRQRQVAKRRQRQRRPARTRAMRPMQPSAPSTGRATAEAEAKEGGGKEVEKPRAEAATDEVGKMMESLSLTIKEQERVRTPRTPRSPRPGSPFLSAADQARLASGGVKRVRLRILLVHALLQEQESLAAIGFRQFADVVIVRRRRSPSRRSTG
ncbi:hypothetical protein BJY59DRAFT_435568 [Rhodotorula toruloides]